MFILIKYKHYYMYTRDFLKYFLLIILVLICTVSCVNAGDNDTVDDSIIVDNDEHVLIGIGDEDIQNEITNESGKIGESNVSTRGVKLYTNIYGEDYVLNHKPMPYIVYLRDIYGNPLTGLTVTFNINGVNYNRVTGSDGSARLNINLPLGNYPIMYSFQGNNDFYASSGSSTISIVDYKLSSSLLANNLTKYYGDSDAFVIYLRDNNYNPLVGETLFLTINNITYSRITGSNGEAMININLLEGTYLLTTVYNGNTYYNSTSRLNSVMINRRATSILGSDLRKYPEDTTPYTIFLKDNLNNSLSNKNILITVNSISYSRTTDNNGFASLDINLSPGSYTITTMYGGDNYYMSSNIVNNIIIIKRTYLTGKILLNMFQTMNNTLYI